MNFRERRDFSTGPVARVSDQWRDGSLGVKNYWIWLPTELDAPQIDTRCINTPRLNGARNLAALPSDVRKASGFPARLLTFAEAPPR